MWLVELGSTVDEDLNRRVLALAGWIRRQRWPGVRDVVPAFASLAVHVSPTADVQAIEDGLRAGLEQPVDDVDTRAIAVVEIPTRYGGADGPDLEAVAAMTGLSTREVVERHVAGTYHVFMLGFLPGFAYLGPLDATIRVARHRVPRTRVAAGSVGIAGAQTGIYPRESPGGWQIIGRTTRTLFDTAAASPSLLTPGDRVRFVPVESLR